MTPRLAAYRVLRELEEAPVRLETCMARAWQSLDEPRDRAMTQNLVYSVLRHGARLDHALAGCLSRPLLKLDPPIRTVLRLGAAEILLLHKAPHAAVHQAVELAKATPARRGQSLINAVLRKLCQRPEDLPGRAGKYPPVRRLALVYSHPAWWIKNLLSRYPLDFVEQWLAANQAAPPLTLRVNTLKASRPQVRALLLGQAARVEEHPLSEDALVVEGAAQGAESLPGFAEGLWQMQDAAAQAMARLLGVAPGMRVLDLCAGAGGKTGHLAALMENQGELLAVDNSRGRMAALTENMRRLGVTCLQTVLADATSLDTSLPPFDRILLDAPCSGLGVLGRRPDIRWRRTPEDCQRLAGLQIELLQRAVGLLKPDGALLYGTCTHWPQENEAVVEDVLAGHPGLVRKWEPQAGAAPAGLTDDGYWRTYPHVHGADGFFAARLVARFH